MNDDHALPPKRFDPIEDRQRTLDALNSIALTGQQIEDGWDAYQEGFAESYAKGAGRVEALAYVQAFCEAAGLQPADIAARSIIIRASRIFLASADGIDLRTEAPETYASYLFDPIEEDELSDSLLY